MASGGRMPVRPVGIGSASPRTLVTNLDLESVHDTSDEWIRTRTGISERRVLVHGGTREAVVAMEEKRRAAVAGLVDPAAGEAEAEEEEEETTTATTTTTTVVPENLRSLGIEAARNALEMSGIDAGDIDLVVCATSSPDDLFGDAPSIGALLFRPPTVLVCLSCVCVCLVFILFSFPVHLGVLYPRRGRNRYPRRECHIS
jgi:3-oxoacyl-[acyl-carrier-protein] synthase-3